MAENLVYFMEHIWAMKTYTEKETCPEMQRLTHLCRLCIQDYGEALIWPSHVG